MFKLMQGTYEDIALSNLDTNTLEPDQRTTERSTTRLMDTIAQSHIITPVSVARVGSKYVLVDGHGRVEAARRLGLTTIPSLVYKGVDAEIVLLRLNTATRRFTNANFLTAYVKAEDKTAVLNEMPTASREHIKTMARVLGHDELERVGLIGRQAPGVVGSMNRIASALVQYGLNGVSNKTILLWVMEHKAQRWVVEYCKTLKPSRAARLHKIVTQNLAPTQLR